MKPKDTFFSKDFSINCHGQLIELDTPKVMGILNLTPDSFYDGGRHNNGQSMTSQIDKIINEGADFIDIGGFSSRPGAELPNYRTETDRLKPALEYIKLNYPEIPVSVDTCNASVASFVIEKYKVDIINDISAGNIDPEMTDVIATWKIPYIAMHMKGTPGNMQKDPQYNDVIDDILYFFAEKIAHWRAKGINDIIIDPGFGFGKTLDHNYELLSALEVFQSLELPLLVGISRKSMIHKLLKISPNEALNGTTALHMFALSKKVKILRVHDVKEAKELVRLHEKLYLQGNSK
jgi:dihydropteroate synthase